MRSAIERYLDPHNDKELLGMYHYAIQEPYKTLLRQEREILRDIEKRTGKKILTI
jgi:hypothetical protein